MITRPLKKLSRFLFIYYVLKSILYSSSKLILYIPLITLYSSFFFISIFLFVLTLIVLYLPICYFYWGIRWVIRCYIIQKKTFYFIVFDIYLKYILGSICIFEIIYRFYSSSWFILDYIDICFYYVGEFLNTYILTFSLTWYKSIILTICYIRLNLKINKYIDTGPEFGGPLEEYFKTQVWKTHQTKAEFQAEATEKAKQAAKEEAAEYNFTSDNFTSDKSTSDK